MSTRVMFIGAHQDDMQGAAAGAFAQLRESLDYDGLEVSLTNGIVGHHGPKYLRDPARLTALRVKEATEAARVVGFDYRLLNDWRGNEFPDADLQITRESKGAVWAAVRDFQPDLLVTLPINDIRDSFGMHNDHTNVGEIVKRIAYLIPAPYAFREYYSEADIEALAAVDEPPYVAPPLIVTTHDCYSEQIDPDIVLDVTAQADAKAEAFAKHVSQAQEWLPWIGRYKAPQSKAELRKGMEQRSRKLAAKLGLPSGIYEAFTLTSWAKTPTLDDVKRFFPNDAFDHRRARDKIRSLSS